MYKTYNPMILSIGGMEGNCTYWWIIGINVLKGRKLIVTCGSYGAIDT